MVIGWRLPDETVESELPSRSTVNARQVYAIESPLKDEQRLTMEKKMKTAQQMVKEFHEIYGLPVYQTVQNMTVSRRELRLKLIEEEFQELVKASGFMFDGAEDLEHIEGSTQDPVEMADALGDLIYVVHGFAHELGVDLNAVVAEIHESNLSKLDDEGMPIVNQCQSNPPCAAADDGIKCVHLIQPSLPVGKVLKGPNYRKPDIASVIFF